MTISYIVADLHHIRPILLVDKNILYNYLMRLLIERIVSEKDNGTEIDIICDNHTIKVSSKNSFADYIKLFLLYEKGYDIKLSVKYMDSDDKNAYIIQAADYVANALYGLHEYNDDVYYNCFKSVVNTNIFFPWKHFGK